MALSETARLIALLELQDKFTKPLGGAMNSLGAAEKKIGTLGKIGSQAGKGLSTAAHNIERIGLAVGGLAVGGLVTSLKLASDLNENINKTTVVFGAAADSVLAFSKTTADSLGLSQNATLDAAGAFGNMFTTIGLANDASASMSTRLVTLAADMASFNNEDPSEMLLRLRSGLAGEAEPLRRFGVLLSEAAVKEEAYATGIAKRGKALTEAQKVQARYSLILKQTAVQQGDFARTSEGLANLQRRLRANLENTATVIGGALLPKVVDLAKNINELVTNNQPAIERFAATLPGAFDKLIKFGGDLPWPAIGEAFKAMGTGSKILLDSFLGLPPWVQTAVITGWGLNKLTGGALGGIAGTLTKALVGGGFGGRGTTPLNPLFVSAVGGGLSGAPVAGGGSLLGTVAKFVIGPAAAVIIGSEIAAALNNPKIQPAIDFEQNQLKAVVDSQDLDRIVDGLNAIEAEQNTDDILAQTALIASNIPFIGDALGHVGPQLEKDRQVLLDQLEQMGLTREQAEQIVAEQKALTEKYGTEATKQINAVNALNIPLGLGNVFAQQIKDKAEATIQKNAAILDSLRGQAGSLIRIAEKNFSPTVRVNVQATSYLSLRTVAGALTSYRISAGGLTGGFTESAESIY